MKLVTKSAALILTAGLLSGCVAHDHAYYYPSTGYYTASRVGPYYDSPRYASVYSCGNYRASYGYHDVGTVYRDGYGCRYHNKYWKHSHNFY
jgi:hypothetical protein